jgi:hypothetical protein
MRVVVLVCKVDRIPCQECCEQTKHATSLEAALHWLLVLREQVGDSEKEEGHVEREEEGKEGDSRS